jgi:hypothetical protein
MASDLRSVKIRDTLLHFCTVNLLMSTITLYIYNKSYQTSFFNLCGKFSAADLEVYPASRIRVFPSRIPDSGSKRYRIPDPDQQQRI